MGSSTEQNKAVVRRFMTEVAGAENVEVVDELLAPDYVNVAMGGLDRAAFKAMLPATRAVIAEQRNTIHDLVAEGDAVVARFTFEYTLTSGQKIEGRGLTYFRFADGRIVEDDPITTPDMMQVLGVLQASASA